MSEQRLVDASVNPREYNEVWVCTCSEYGKQEVMAIDDISCLPEIDPETLQIVRELRERLEEVTLDRKSCVEALVEQSKMYTKIGEEAAELREKLERYEKAEQEGRLVELPCKVGDRVFILTDKYNIKHCDVCCYAGYGMKESCPYYLNEKCTNIADRGNGKGIVCVHFKYEYIPMIGKIVFLTREEAENALLLKNAKNK